MSFSDDGSNDVFDDTCDDNDSVVHNQGEIMGKNEQKEPQDFHRCCWRCQHRTCFIAASNQLFNHVASNSHNTYQTDKTVKLTLQTETKAPLLIWYGNPVRQYWKWILNKVDLEAQFDLCRKSHILPAQFEHPGNAGSSSTRFSHVSTPPPYQSGLRPVPAYRTIQKPLKGECAGHCPVS